MTTTLTIHFPPKKKKKKRRRRERERETEIKGMFHTLCYALNEINE